MQTATERAKPKIFTIYPFSRKVFYLQTLYNDIQLLFSKSLQLTFFFTPEKYKQGKLKGQEGDTHKRKRKGREEEKEGGIMESYFMYFLSLRRGGKDKHTSSPKVPEAAIQ